MMGAYIYLTIFVVTIDLGLFSPTPIDDLTINLNLNESPKGYEEDDFNNNDYQAPHVYNPTIVNYVFNQVYCTVMLEDGQPLESKAIRPKYKWTSPEPVDKATINILCKLAGGEECDQFYDFYGTTDADWVVNGGREQSPCQVEKKLKPYYPTIMNRYTEDITCSIKLKGDRDLESTAIPPNEKWTSRRIANRATTYVLCIKGGHEECNPFYDLYGTTNPDWVVNPTSESCEVNKAPILYKPTIRNKYDREVACQVTLKGGKVLYSTPIPPNQEWMSNEQVNEETTLVRCTFGDKRCEHFRDDRGTKHAAWAIIENYISKPCKIVRDFS